MRYAEVHRRSLADPDGFWREAAGRIDWSKPFEAVVDTSKSPFNSWFAGGELNTCHNALDRHVQNGRADQVALIHDSPVTGAVTKFTFSELLDRVARLAGGLKARGVAKGDRVVIYMPAVPEAVIAMLACARLGAIHSVVFGGFAANELATRIDDAKPKAILSASCGIEGARVIPYKPMLDAAIDLAANKPDFVGMLQRVQAEAPMKGGRDVDWADLQGEPAACVPVAATDPLYILYTSGTTGAPKGVVRDNGGHAVVLAWTMDNLYATKPGEVFWAASDIGWQVGHSYITYGPLLHGATALLFEGKPVGTPDAGTFWRVIAEHDVKVLFTAPTAIRAIRREDPNGEFVKKHDISGLRALFLAGERTDPETLRWAEEHLGVPVVDHWWQTETGWPIAGNPLGIERLPVKPGSTSVPMPGWDVRCLDADHNEVPAGETGDIVLKLPMAPGRGCGLSRPRRLHLHPQPHRRRDQRRRSPALDRADGGSALLPCRRRRMLRHRRGGPAQGPGAARLPGAEGGRDAGRRRYRGRDGRDGARDDRPGRVFQAGPGRRAPAEDALGQDPARHDPEDRGCERLEDARNHRGPRGVGRDRDGARGNRLRSRETGRGRGVAHRSLPGGEGRVEAQLRAGVGNTRPWLHPTPVGWRRLALP